MIRFTIRMVQRDKYASYRENQVDQRNLELLAIDIYKTQKNHNPSLVKLIFVMKDTPYPFVVARISLHQNQNVWGTVLKVPVFLDLGYGMHCHHP